MKVVIQNRAHREFIEERECFDVVEFLGLKCCGLCSAYGVLTLVPDDAPDLWFHHYTGTDQCVDVPVCDECLEQGGGSDLEEWLSTQSGIELCSDVGCVSATEDLREIRALKRDPLSYGYEAYPSVYNVEVSIEKDVTRAGFRPAGDIRAFATEEARDAWVHEGSTGIFNSSGYIEKYRCRSAIPAETGRKLYLPNDEGNDVW